jgi:hypothetical protein
VMIINAVSSSAAESPGGPPQDKVILGFKVRLLNFEIPGFCPGILY